MSWWYPRLNAAGEIASGNGAIWLNGVLVGAGHSPQWGGADEVLVDGDRDGLRWLNVRTGATFGLGFECNARVGNTSGISAGAGHWCGWNPTQGLIRDGQIVDPEAAPGAIDQQSGALYYLTPYQRNIRQVVIWPGTILRHGILATEIVAGDECCTWSEYEQVRTLYGWCPERGVERLSPLAATELLFVGIPVQTPSGRWLVTQTNLGLIVYPWGDTRGYIIEGEWFYHDARYLDGLLRIVGTNSRGALIRRDLNLAAARVDLTRYYPTSGTNPDPQPPQPPDPQPPEDDMRPPVVTVDRWTLSDVLEGREFAFHDGGNPELAIAARIWVEGGVMYAQLTNKAGTARTGMARVVTPCSQPPDPQPEPPEPQPEPEPEPTDRFTLKRADGGYLCVGPDRYLTQQGTPATFELVEQGGGEIGLRANGAYVACESDRRLKADRQTVGEWEEWEPQTLDEQAGTLALRSVFYSAYLSCADDGSVKADQLAIGGWETLVKGTPTSGRPPIPGPLTATTDRIFRDAVGAPWRYRGVSAFPLCRRYADGQDIQPFLQAFPGFNVLRVWDYVPWSGTGWESCSVDQWRAFLAFVQAQGWYVELTLLTDDNPGRISYAQTLVQGLAGIPNLIVEIGNEPQTNKSIDTRALQDACTRSGLLYSSGNYESNAAWFGRYGTAHTPRDSEWPRKGHDLMEYYGGGGPHAPSDPACKAPWVGDEPIRPDQCNPAWYAIDRDYQAYGGVCALLGAGATFHFEGGKYGTLPNDLERACAAAMLTGLMAFPADAPNWGYRRIDEQGKSLRTYVLGDRVMVRVRPTTPEPPEPGWTALDEWHQLWQR